MVLLWEDYARELEAEDSDESSLGLEEVPREEFSYHSEVMCDAASPCSRACDCGDDACGAGSSSAPSPSLDPAPSLASRVPPCLGCNQVRAQFMCRQREPLCRECLEKSLWTKVKTAVFQPGKKDAACVKEGDALAVACSGGFNSMALVHFLSTLAAEEAQRRKPRFERALRVVHVVTESGAEARAGTRALPEF